MSERARISDSLLQQVLNLRAVGALGLKETRPGSGVFRYRTRAAGWPVNIDLDTTVLEIRAYFGDDVEVIATGPVPEQIMDALVDPAASVTGSPGSDAKKAREAIRAIVSEWRAGNPRVFMHSPRVARHPDGWNNS